MLYVLVFLLLAAARTLAADTDVSTMIYDDSTSTITIYDHSIVLYHQHIPQQHQHHIQIRTQHGVQQHYGNSNTYNLYLYSILDSSSTSSSSKQ
jgi:hypothetical protein